LNWYFITQSKFSCTEELSVEEVDSIKTEIADGTHLLIWKNKVQQDDLKKQLTNAKSEGTKLEATTFVSMSTNG